MANDRTCSLELCCGSCYLLPEVASSHGKFRQASLPQIASNSKLHRLKQRLIGFVLGQRIGQRFDRRRGGHVHQMPTDTAGGG
jgi:hypothetical protein